MTRVTLHIEGMSCGHCLNAVRGALDAVPGVRVKSVSIGRAELEVDEHGPSPEAIAGVVTDEGYRATPSLAG